MNKRVFVGLFVFALCYFIAFDSFGQCAMCKQAAASSLDKNPNSLARGLNSGILYLMAIPYLLIAFIFRKQIVSLYRKWRYKGETSELN
jgi:hypothetical protein